MKLDIGCGKAGTCLEKTGSKAGGHRHRTIPCQQIPQGDPGLPEDVVRLDVDGRQIGPKHGARLQVILEVPADTDKLAPDANSMALQLFARADTREHQNVGRANRAGTQDHFATRRDVEPSVSGYHLQAGHAAIDKHQALDKRLDEDLEIPPFPGGAQIGDSSAAPASPDDRLLDVADAFLITIIVVGVAAVAGRDRGLDPQIDDLASYSRRRNHERAISAAGVAGPELWALPALGAPEVRQDIVPGPALVSKLAPVVVVLCLAANIEKAIDRTRSSKHPSAWPGNRSAIETMIGCRAIAPIGPGIVHGLEVTDRDVDPRIAVSSACLDKGNAVTAIRSEAVGKDATGGTGSNDDEIELHALRT